MKAHSETHFENENMFLEKWKVINPFLKNLFQPIVEAATGASAIHHRTLCGLYPRTYLTLK